MPTAYTRTRVRRKPVPRETRVPTAIPALDRIRLERWVAAGAGVPACRPPVAGPAGPRGPPPGPPWPPGGGPGGPGAPGGMGDLVGVGVKVGCGRGGWTGADPAGLAGSGGA